MKKIQTRFLLIAVVCAIAIYQACTSNKRNSKLPSAIKSNKVLGSWKTVTVQVDPDGKNQSAFGQEPKGLLVFTANMQYIELMYNSSVPKFKLESLGQGTAAGNKAAFEGSLAQYGTYTVDKDGEFLGNRVDGATFPNWIGNVRTRKDLTLEVNGDRMVENFKQPDGTKVRVLWERVR